MRKGGKSHMELDDLLKLIDHVSKSKLDDFCYETGEIKLRLKKNAAKQTTGTLFRTSDQGE